MAEFGIDSGMIISEKKEQEEEKGGKKIIYKPLWKWLLEMNK